MTRKKRDFSFPTIPIIVSVVLGIFVGHYHPLFAVKFKFFGDIFLNILFSLVVPLIISSMISAISSLGDIRHLGSLGFKTVLYYLSTTFMAALTGIILVNLITPGKQITAVQNEFPNADYTIIQNPVSGGSTFRILSDTGSLPENVHPDRHQVELLDQHIVGFIDPDGVIGSDRVRILTWLDDAGKKTEPRLSGTGWKLAAKTTRMGIDEYVTNFVPRNIFRLMVEENIFPLILFCLFFGAVLTTVGEAGKPLIQLINAVNVTILKCVTLLMYIAPLGIFGLIAARIGEAELSTVGGFIEELMHISRYFFTALLGIAIHGCITLVLILKFIGKRRTLPFIKNLIPMILTAFSTDSSVATLPVSLKLTIERNKVSERIANFVLPLGATLNMDGTALYEGVAAIFIAQLYNIQLGFGEQVIVLFTATIAAIGAAGIPQAGLITMVLVLKSVGLPLEGIGIIISIDWLLDRFRTICNCWGDIVGAAVIDRFEKNTLAGSPGER